MATKNFTQFDLRTELLTSDYIVGFKQDGTSEIKATVKQIVDLVQDQDSDNQTLAFNESAKLLSITSGNTVSLSAFATNDSLQLIAPPPTYISPTAFLSEFTQTSFEIGELITQTLTLNWNQNDAGTFIPGDFKKNNILVSQVNFLSALYGFSETVSLGTTTYQLSVNFGDGPIKNNVLGLPDSRGQILAGSVIDTSSYTGYYRRWIGSSSSFPASPNDIRTLSLSTSLDTNNTLASQASPIYIDNNFILIAIPNTKSLASVVTEVNENLTSQFNLSSVQIPDAGSTLRDYKLYYLETALPLNLNLINVTIA